MFSFFFLAFSRRTCLHLSKHCHKLIQLSLGSCIEITDSSLEALRFESCDLDCASFVFLINLSLFFAAMDVQICNMLIYPGVIKLRKMA